MSSCVSIGPVQWAELSRVAPTGVSQSTVASLLIRHVAHSWQNICLVMDMRNPIHCGQINPCVTLATPGCHLIHLLSSPTSSHPIRRSWRQYLRESLCI